MLFGSVVLTNSHCYPPKLLPVCSLGASLISATVLFRSVVLTNSRYCPPKFLLVSPLVASLIAATVLFRSAVLTNSHYRPPKFVPESSPHYKSARVCMRACVFVGCSRRCPCVSRNSQYCPPKFSRKNRNLTHSLPRSGRVGVFFRRRFFDDSYANPFILMVPKLRAGKVAQVPRKHRTNSVQAPRAHPWCDLSAT